MIDLYYWTTPNGHKITIFLEESQLEYDLKLINLKKRLENLYKDKYAFDIESENGTKVTIAIPV